MFLLVLALALLELSCGDGSHRSSGPSWTLGDNDDLSGDTSVVTLDCVNVVSYKNIKASELNQPENLTPGDVTTNSLNATTVMFRLATGVDDETKALHKCIETEIETLKGSGSEHYWGNMTYVLTRTYFSRKPKKSTVRVIDLTGCSQVQSADCLLTD